jgi:hypothetical protein
MTKDIATPTQNPYGPPEDGAGMVQGKWVILGVVGLSVLAASASWFYYARLQERPLALWGVRSAEMMLRAPMAKAFRIVPMAERPPIKDTAQPALEFSVAGERYVAVAEHEISQAHGFSHIRNSLIHDRSFVWDEAPCESAPRWEYVIQFVDGDERTAVVLAFNCPRAAPADTDRIVSIRPVAAEIEDFLQEQFPAEAASAADSQQE